MAGVINCGLSVLHGPLANQVTITLTCASAAEAEAVKNKLMSDGLDARRLVLDNLRFDRPAFVPVAIAPRPASMDDH